MSQTRIFGNLSGKKLCIKIEWNVALFPVSVGVKYELYDGMC